MSKRYNGVVSGEHTRLTKGALSGSRVIGGALKRTVLTALSVTLVFGSMLGLATAYTVATSAPASATTTTVCTAPASGGTSTSFYVGAAGSYSVACYGESGVSGTTAYPSAINVTSGALPTDATFPTTTPGCTQSTSGSGANEEYILTCKITETPVTGDIGSYPVKFTATASPNGGTATQSGTLTLGVVGPDTVCTAPASGGTSTSFVVGVASSYSVACYGSDSPTADYPTAINIASGALPTDASFPTTTPGCTQSTSGSGSTEEYILTCKVTETPVTGDIGSYPETFTATGGGSAPNATSGTWTLNVVGPDTVCTAPAAGGTSTTFTEGVASSYSVACYGSNSTTADYPTAINVASGTLPGDASFPTSAPGCTQSTSGSGSTEEYILTCKVTETPTATDIGTYHLTFTATGGGGASNTTSGTWNLTVAQPAPSWATDGTTDGNYFSAINGVPFCDNIGITNAGGSYEISGGTPNPAVLPLTSITAGTTPSGVSNYQIENVNLATGTAQICGTNNNTAASAPVTMAPVATNGGGSVTDSIPLWSQNECTWTASNGTVSMFDSNQDLEQVGSQSSFGQPISNGEIAGTSTNYATCPGNVGVSASGGLGDAWTVNTANPLPSPTDTNPSAAQGDLASSNLELAKGCYGGVNILASTSTTSFGTTSKLTLPSPWVNGGDCSYGTLGSNSAGGNTDTTNATCAPSQADVNEGYVDCSITASSGNDENGSVNYSTMDLFLNGQPVPQTSTATLSASSALAGGTLSVTGGTNWWGSSGGAPNSGPYGDSQSGDFYQVSAPSVYVGTSRGTAVPVASSTVAITANRYVCTGAESTTVGPNPCTMTPGQPTGSVTLPDLAPGTYNLYIDESNTTPLPGNGPNDAYQTARATNLGTAESSDSITVPSPLSLTESSTSTGYGAAGDTVALSYLLTNNSATATLTGVGVTDTLGVTVSCPSSSLAPGASENCTGNYTALQSDVDAGSIYDQASAVGTDGYGGANDDTATSSVTVPASDATEALTVAASTTTPYFTAEGQSVPYSYLVTNNGSETLTSVSVSDPGVAALSCPSSSLAPETDETCTGNYTTTAADVTAGSVTDAATASAQNPQGTSVTSAPSSTTTDLAGLTLVKSTTSSGYGAAGDTIDYNYLVTNTGTSTLSDIAVSDNLIASVSCPDATLASGADENCTGSYTVTQADVDAGAVTNTATASANPPSGPSISSNSSSVTVDASNATSSLTLVKSTSSTGYGAAGDTIDYNYLVTNTGTTTLSDVAVSDNLIASVSCPDATLAPGADENCTGSYTVTQADVAAGAVNNTATASANPSSGPSISSNSSSVTVLYVSLTLVKSTTSSGYGAAGDTIDYNYLVTNTGTSTLSDIAVSDNLIASVSCPDATLASGADENCTGSYTVTQADVDAGAVTNTATASANPPSGPSISSNSSSVTVDASNATSSLTLVKSTSSTGYGAAGDTIDYNYLVTNTGTTTLSDVAVSDNLIASVSCPDATLAPGADENCTGSYTVTQADVAAGAVNNTATASANPPSGPSISSNSSSVTVGYTGFHITTTSLPPTTVGQPYSATLSATDGTAPYKWTAVSPLPTGIKLSSGGVLSGKAPILVGNYTISVRAATTRTRTVASVTYTRSWTLVDTQPGPSGVTCSRLSGAALGNIEISGCLPRGGASYVDATGPASALASVGTPGVLTWSGGATTTVVPSAVNPVTVDTCRKGSSEVNFVGMVTAESGPAGIGIPKVGDTVSANACVSATLTLTLAAGQKMNL